jgi:hypothetical protein
MKRFGTNSTQAAPQDIEKMKERAERFGTSVKEVEQEKRNQRLERFGQSAHLDAIKKRKKAKYF